MVWNGPTTSGTTAGMYPDWCCSSSWKESDSGGCRSGVSATDGAELVAGRQISSLWYGRTFEEAAGFFHGSEDTDCGPIAHSPGGGSRGNLVGRWLSTGWPLGTHCCNETLFDVHF
jgi:hypothetical protein